MLVTSCHREVEYDHRLLRAEQVAEEHPDSALALLNAVDAALLSRPDSALYGLLRAQALYKCYRPVSADTLLPQALTFFEEKGDERRLTHALFYMGAITYSSEKNSVNSLPFLKEAEYNAHNSHDTVYIIKCCELLFVVFNEENNYTYSMNYARELYHYSALHGDSTFMAIAQMNIASSFMLSHQPDSSLVYYLFVKNNSRHLPEDYQYILLSNIGACYYEKKDYNHAKEYLQRSIKINSAPQSLTMLADILWQENKKKRSTIHVGLFQDFVSNYSTEIYAIPSKLKGTKKCIGAKW